MAQEIRLGSSESMKNINLGSTEIQEVYLGATLIWRNNVPPFYTVSINGTVISSNGTIITPVKPPKPGDIVTKDFQYTSNIPVLISNIQEEDQPYNNIVFNLYEGNFEEDDTLPVIDTFTTVQGTDGTFTIPRGPQPTGANASDFIYDDKLFTITSTDSEGGVSIQFLKITRVDSADYKVYGSWSNSGGQYNQRTSTSTQGNLQSVSFDYCYAEEITTTSFTRHSVTPVASQNQTRTCSVQIVGVQDVPAKVCSGSDKSRTVTVTTGTATTQDTVTGTSTSANPNFVSGYNVVVPSNQTSTSSSSVGPCENIAGGAACGRCEETCSGTGTQAITTTETIINRNCANQQVSTSPGGTTTTSKTCSGSYANPARPTSGLISSGFGSQTSVNFSSKPSTFRSTSGLPNSFSNTRSGVCKPGFTISRCEITENQVSWAITSGGLGQDNCTVNLSGTVSKENHDYCSTSALAISGGFDGVYVITATILMECT
jgi:hypothetical protein